MAVRRNEVPLSSWRRLALSTWGPPRDPTAYGTLDLDAEAALAYVQALRARTSLKITLTHLVGKCVALAIAKIPEANAYVSRGRLIQRETVDVFFQVSFFDDGDERALPPRGATGEGATKPDGRRAELGGAKIRAADTKSIEAIARELNDKAAAIRANEDADTTRGAQTLARVPMPFVGFATRAAAYLQYDRGIDLSRFGVPFDPFGACMVTNVGVFGITEAHAPLVEMSRASIVITVGEVHEAPSVVNGILAVRRRVSLGVAFDHRVLDGYHAGVMAKSFRAAFADPAAELGE